MSKINSKKEYLIVLKNESKYYNGGFTNFKEKILLLLKKDIDLCYIREYMKSLRTAEYYLNCSKSLFWKIKYILYERKKNRLGSRLGISISDNVLGINSILYHPNIIINPCAKVGDGCIFHGNNCIGNKDNDNEKVPIIGNGVDFGFGAVVIGAVTIADDIKIGANSVVTSSFLQKGAVIAGNPAKIINSRS